MDWPSDVDPGDLRQPDARSCGAASMVAARVLVEPGFRPGGRAEASAEILRTHARLTSLTGADGRAQVPWPPALGTPPWAVASALAELTGDDVRTWPSRWRPAEAWGRLGATATRPVAVYVGNAWLPRHVVLAVGLRDDGRAVEVFDPAAGRLVDVRREAWDGQHLDVAGWSHVWAVL